jgi:hypothetical protein
MDEVYKRLAEINNLEQTDDPVVWKSKHNDDLNMNLRYRLTSLGFTLIEDEKMANNRKESPLEKSISKKFLLWW